MDKKLSELYKNHKKIKSTIEEKKMPHLHSSIGAGEILKLNSLYVKNFFSIQNIELINLEDKKEVYIVGENGDGKTLFLQSIVIALKGIQVGEIFDLIKTQTNSYISIDKNNPFPINNTSNCLYIPLLAYGASRNNNCQLKEDNTGYLTLFSGEYDLKSPIKWLIDLYNAQNAKEKTIISLSNAIKLLQYLLNKDIEINVTYKNVTFTEKGSEVSFDQLSAGYKGVITIICDLLARLS